MNDLATAHPTFGLLILAGGKSSRMGRDKASLPYRGQTLLSHMRALGAAAGAAPILIGGGASADLPDPVAGAGPVGSLCALAQYVSETSCPLRWAIVPVDMPLVTPRLLGLLAQAPGDAAAFADHPLPVGLTFTKSTLAVFASIRPHLSQERSLAVREVLQRLNARTLNVDPDTLSQLRNVNTPEEWSRLNDRS